MFPPVLFEKQIVLPRFRWGCLLRYINDRIAPVIAQPRQPPGLPAPGHLPDLG